MTNIKKRNWAFILYLDSAPSDWKDILQATGLPIAISPYHDKDVNPDGTPKKPHYHIILMYNNTTTFNSVKQLTDRLNQPIPIPLEQVKGYYRYFTHKDNAEKYQYNENDITTLNGFDYTEFIELTTSEVMAIKKQIQNYIRDNVILEYSILMDSLLDNDFSNMYDVASNNTYFFDKYITSFRNRYNKYKDSFSKNDK